jgi:DinB superfamily
MSWSCSRERDVWRAGVVAEPEGFADTFVFLYQQIHDQLRDEISNLSEPALSWVPGPDTSSISTLVLHLLGSETEVFQIVRGLRRDRDRDSEFSARIGYAEELLRRIDATDRLLRELGPQITDYDLDALRVRPSAVTDKGPRTGLYWLVHNYGHAREHLAQLRLTKQLFRQTHRGDLLDR